MEKGMHVETRDSFKSQFGMIMSMAGLAIGLGNCWRFPYLCGKWGGGAFVFAYLLCALLVVFPCAIVEVGIGKGFHKGLIDVYGDSYHNKTLGYILGGFSSFCQWGQNFYYLAIVAALVYMIKATLTAEWNIVQPDLIYDTFTKNTTLYIALYLIVLALLIYTGIKGVSKGIEKISNIMVPMLFALFVITFILLCVFTPNIADGLNYYLNPDFNKLANPSLWTAALGQALFSIGVGPGALLIYGSHIKDDGEVPVAIATTCCMDTLAGLLAGLAIIPACVAMGIDPESGSGLIFIVLPTVFSKIPFGQFIGCLMFIGIICAAYTSACSNQETAITTWSDGLNIDRKKVVFIMGIINLIFGIACMLNAGQMSFWQTLTGDYTFLPFAAIGSITYAYVYGVSKIRTKFINPSTEFKMPDWFDKYIRLLAVPVLVIVMLYSFVQLFI